MKNQFFILILNALISSSIPSFAMNNWTINNLSPIRKGMSQDEEEKAINDFLSRCVEKGLLFNPEDIVKSQQHTCIKKDKTFTYTTYTLKDGTEWVKKPSIEHFMGAFYLSEALKQHKFERIRVADTRFCLENEDEGFTIETSANLSGLHLVNSLAASTYVQWMGDEEYFEDQEEDDTIKTEFRNLFHKTRFSDKNPGNVRKKDNLIYIIDTDYHGFCSN